MGNWQQLPNNMKRYLLLILGFFLLGLGALGILLPVLPTTPFVLVAATCFAGSSPVVYKWLVSTRYFGDFIENYRNHTGVPMNVKAVALGFLWGILLLSAFLSANLYITLLLAVVGICVTIHILKLKTRRTVKKADEPEF